MNYQYTDPSIHSFFLYTDHLVQDLPTFQERTDLNYLIWNRSEEDQQVEVDSLEITIKPYQILTTTFFHQLRISERSTQLTALAFNRPFYCTVDHDEEVSCNGILFFGTQDLPIISVPTEHQRKFDLLLEVILDEFRTRDNIQGDMLQMLLKRFIIITTRLAKEQLMLHRLDDAQIETIRKFNFLVDMHFREKRKVKDYAELLYKSPKTLSNLFAIYNQRSPQQ
ncbi:MAG: AraC family transcriptional regulator, partial [Bacteroidota bacterium]